MSVWGGTAYWDSGIWNDNKQQFSRDFSVAGSTATATLPRRVRVSFTASTIARAGSLTLTAHLALHAALKTATVIFTGFSFTAAHFAAAMASFSATVGRAIRLTLAAATSGAIVTGYGSGGYGLGGYGSSATAPQIVVSKGIQASMTALSGSLSKTLLVALKLFRAVTSSVAATLHEKVAIGFAAGMASFKGFAYGLIRKIRVRGGR